MNGPSLRRRGGGLLHACSSCSRLASGYRLRREEILEALWPEAEPDAANNRLHQALYVLRRTLEPDLARWAPPRFARLDGDEVALAPAGSLRVDVEAFEAAARRAVIAEDAAAIAAALARYGGDLLPEDRYDDAFAGRREALRGRLVALCRRLAELEERRGAVPAAIAALERLVALEPTHEAATAALMRLESGGGQAEQALRRYEHLRAALRRDLGTQPSAQLRRLRDEIAARARPGGCGAGCSGAVGTGPTAGAAADGPRSPATNLPGDGPALVGRDDALAAVGALLAARRLVTLSGFGGVGKTRLAVEVARRALDQHPDGAFLVDLAGIGPAAALPPALASVLGVREQPGRDLVETLADALRGRRLLLLLDNCEPLVDAAAALAARLLGDCPGLRVLATSREALHIPGEAVVPLPPLDVPAAGARPAEELAAVASVRLFLERAQAARPTLRLTPDNAADVAAICRRLEGIPLALELAAALLRAQPLERLVAGLDDAPGLLTPGNPLAPARQRTLRATLDWSRALLGPAEQALLRRLSVFAGGWTLDAAEAVASSDDGELPRGAILPALYGLVDRSLVVVEERGDRARYRLLEPVRQYAAELLAAGESERLGGRHRDWFLALALQARRALVGPEQRAWLERVEQERDNFRAALAWSVQRGEAVPALGLAYALWRPWYIRGYPAEGRRWLEAALAIEPRPADASGRAWRARAAQAAGDLARLRGDMAAARAHYEASLALQPEVDDPDSLAAVLSGLGDVARWCGELAQAEAWHRQCLDVQRAAGDRRGVAYALCNLGQVARSRGDVARALVLSEAALALGSRLPDQQSLVAFAQALAEALLLAGQDERARSLAEENLARARAMGYQDGIAGCLAVLAVLARRAGNASGAAARLRECLAVLWDTRSVRDLTTCLEEIAGLLAAGHDPTLAARLFGATAARRGAQGGTLPLDPAQHERDLAAARARLGEPAFAAAAAEGRRLPLGQVVAQALAALEPAGH